MWTKESKGYNTLHAIWEGMIKKFTSCFEARIKGVIKAG